MKINVVVVTYNRKKLLEECLNAILSQTYKINKLILVDNNSNDGTFEMLNENKYLNNELIIYKKLDKNIGGAGGFYEGMKESLNYPSDWVWIMDDDTIPTKNCLEELVNSIKEIKGNISFVASSIYGANGEFMNVPSIDCRKSDSGYPSWYEYLSKGIVSIERATFVSLLINNDAILKNGLPMKNYFIWGDDSEYTMRITKFYGKAYLVGNSVAIHKRAIAKSLSIYEEDNINRINFYYYNIRNNLINTFEYSGNAKGIKLFLSWQYKSLKLFFQKNCKYKLLKFKKIHKALINYTFKLYDKKAFRNRFDINVKYTNEGEK